jgi:hypothetical protein
MLTACARIGAVKTNAPTEKTGDQPVLSFRPSLRTDGGGEPGMKGASACLKSCEEGSYPGPEIDLVM